MREIKFRGRRVDNEEWVYGNLIIDEHGRPYIGQYITPKQNDPYISAHRSGKTMRRFAGIGFFMVDPETVGQFTGLCDEDENETYDGDICLDNEDDVFFIDWDGGSFRANYPHGDIYLLVDPIDGAKRIGNIHENPGLLKIANG